MRLKRVMDKFVEYAPVIIVVMGFFIAYKVFVTPAQLKDAIDVLKENIEEKYVKKETNEVIIQSLKEDMKEIKDKIDVIYNKIMGTVQ